MTRICDRISKPSAQGLKNCEVTGMDCVTYSRNMTYVFKCNKFRTSQRRQGEGKIAQYLKDYFICGIFSLIFFKKYFYSITIMHWRGGLYTSYNAEKRCFFLLTSAYEIDYFGNIRFILWFSVICLCILNFYHTRNSIIALWLL